MNLIAIAATATPAPVRETTFGLTHDGLTIVGGLILAVVSPIIAVLVSRWLAMPQEARFNESLAVVTSDLACEREERKALRDRIDSRDQHKFELLHEKRSDAMRIVYAALCDLDDAVHAFANSHSGFSRDPGPAQRLDDLSTAGNAYRAAFWPNRILFDEELASDLSRLNRATAKISHVFVSSLAVERAIAPETDDEKANRKLEFIALRLTLESDRYKEAIEQIPPLIVTIEKQFRALYGVIDNPS